MVKSTFESNSFQFLFIYRFLHLDMLVFESFYFFEAFYFVFLFGFYDFLWDFNSVNLCLQQWLYIQNIQRRFLHRWLFIFLWFLLWLLLSILNLKVIIYIHILEYFITWINQIIYGNYLLLLLLILNRSIVIDSFICLRLHSNVSLCS